MKLSTQFKKALLLCGLFFALFLCFFVYSGLFLSDNPKIREEKNFAVKKKEDVFKIGEELEKANLIRSRAFFAFYVILTGKEKKLQAGNYSFSPAMSIVEIAGKIIEGRTVKEILAIPEGWDIWDIAEELEKREICSQEEFLELVGFGGTGNPENFSDEFDFLKDKPKELGLEGYLFPDTYEIEKDASVKEIVRKFLVNFGTKLNEGLREEIKKQNKTIFQVITMASMLEKEVKTHKEKKLASGVLWRRLAAGMPLQVDATVNYITGEKSARISLEETRIDSSYNTYQYYGLPLGPISNPGLESILAALYPEGSGYWYYFSTPEGKTIFSRTYKEHKAGVEKFLK